jgi:ankyrin repeat protein
LSFRGDPGKYDRFGNTGLHLAAAGGHTKCVAFLIDMGMDVWAMNVDGRTPRDLAAACPNGEVSLRLLDAAMAKEIALNPKKAQAKKERAQQRAQKLNAEYRK